MKKRIAALLLCILSLLALASCSNDLPEGATLPDGMQYAGGEELGFFLYVPEEWTLTSTDGVVGAYVSTLDLSSVSLASVEKSKDTSIDAYFKATMEDMPFEDYKLEKEGVSRLLGTVSGKGYEFTYTYKPYGATDNETNKYRVMQVFAEHQGRLYVFTYTALDEQKSASSEDTYFQTHIEKVNKILDNLQFTTPKKATDTPANYEKDADGYLKVTTKKSSGFELYMHPDWECTLDGGMAEIISPDKNASINIAESKDNGVSPSDYFAKRKSDLERYTDGEITVISQDVATEFGNAATAWAYEYTYTYRGETYHTYQVLVIDEKIPALLYKGYVFTYTATEDAYAAELDTVKKMIAKVNF